MGDNDQSRLMLIEFLRTIARLNSSFDNLGDDDNLIDAGIIDSLAVIHIIVFLESEYGIRLGASNISPADFMSINSILDLRTREQ
jgi:methoxymalonate biosynthesis acyl carrier protein